MVRTRFAPSPTGSLHVGNARIAVLNWLLARHHGGAFLLRIEDTDRERTVPGADAAMAEDLVWLGLDWDEGPAIAGVAAARGDRGPYRQSERMAIYRDHAARLLDAGHAFRCFCSPEQLEARRREALARSENPVYDGTCRRLGVDDVRRLLDAGRSPAIRFRVPPHGEVRFHDAVRGDVAVAAATVGDFIILRSDGVPTYNFAVVVDDALMAVTHVIRGAGHLSNTPRQVLLYDALELPLPAFAHVPTVLGPDRQKLSKRHGAQALADYRREGYHPDALVNYLSLLSWSSPSGDEFLDRDRLVAEISLDRLGAADVVFDAVKLRWLSSKHIERMPLDELVAAISPLLDRDLFPIPEEVLPAAVEAVRSHLATFTDINEHLDAFVPTLDDEALDARDRLRGDPIAAAVLRETRAALHGLEHWTQDAISDAVRAAGARVSARGRALYEPLRVALTGRPHGPPLAAVAFVLGREHTLRLLEGATAGSHPSD